MDDPRDYEIDVDAYTPEEGLDRNEQLDREDFLASEQRRAKAKNAKKTQKKVKKKKIAWRIGLVLVVLVILFVSPFIWLFSQYRNLDHKEYNVDPEIKEFVHEPIEADEEIERNLSDDVYWSHKDVMNILLIGCDYGSEKLYYPRSDSMMIASINKRTQTLNFVSLSRATYVAIEGHNNNLLNHAHAFGGPELLIQTIEKNYKIRIDNYISVDFDGFISLVDVLDGVDVSLTQAEATAVGVGEHAGNYHLDGEHALAFARTRSIDTDRARTGRQREIMISLTKKAMKISSISVFSDMLDKILPFVSTDMKYFEVLGYASDALTNHYFRYTIKEAVVPTGYVPLTRVGEMDVLIVNWASVKSDIHSILYAGLEDEIAAELEKSKN